jgi:hypothetical protein
MAFHIHTLDAIGKGAKRYEFPPSVIEELEKLIQLLTGEIALRVKSLNVAKELNKSLAIFLRSLLSIMNRGKVLSMVRDVIIKVQWI